MARACLGTKHSIAGVMTFARFAYERCCYLFSGGITAGWIIIYLYVELLIFVGDVNARAWHRRGGAGPNRYWRVYSMAVDIA